MPFGWNDRPATTTSGAPSGRISASPTQPRSGLHRRGLPHSGSMSSNISAVSGSTRSPGALSVPKASTSAAALTSADESDDFKRFLDEAQAQDEQQRRKKQGLTAGRERAAESLRRVASSSTLNSAAPSTSVRQTATLSAATATRPPRSVSNYSMFRNPTSQVLEQLSAPTELGIDDTPVSGRSVDSRSHLTALGQAAKLQSRSASGSYSRSATLKGKAPVARSSSVAAQSPAAAQAVPLSRSTAVDNFAAASPRGPLSPKRRPQSYIHKPPAEASGVVSPRKLGVSPRKAGATDLGLGFPTSPQAKRSADEMERSSSLNPSAKLQGEATKTMEGASMQASPSQASSRRKTWFGLGLAADVDEPAAGEVKDGGMQVEAAVQDRPPPPMSEDEAEFRRSLGYDDVFDAKQAFPAGARDLDATIKAEPVVVRARERRVSWLPWRNVPEVEGAGSQGQVQEQPQQQQDQQQMQQQQKAEPARQASETTSMAIPEETKASKEVQMDDEDTVTYRTVVKRGWMGARYEVQEPVPGLRDMFDARAADAAQTSGQETAAGTKSVQEQDQGQQPLPEPVQGDSSYPPPAPAGDSQDSHARQASATWRWKFWSGHEDRPEVDASSAAQQLQVPDALPAAGVAEPQQQQIEVDTAVPMDIDQDGHPSMPPTAPEGGSWTYSSYLASWVPTWVYNAQQQEAAANASAEPLDEMDSNSTSTSTEPPAAMPPRTPAEQVKADALARDASAAVFDANKAVLNSNTRGGWIKFFGSRSANLPREAAEAITNDDGMEVMDISDMEGSARPAAARNVVVGNDRLTADAARAPRARTTTNGSVAGSKASSLAGEAEAPRPATPLSTSKDSVKNLSKAVITKAANATAASTLGLGKGKRSDAAQGGTNTSSSAVNTGSSSQPAKDISKNVAPIGPSRTGATTPTRNIGNPLPAVAPNLVLPSFEDTFTRAPRMWPPKVGVLERTLSAVNSYLFRKVPDLERMKRPTRYSTYGEPSLGSSASSFKGGAASVKGVRPAQRLAGKAKATGVGSSKDKGVETALKEVAESAQRLPRAWSTVGMHEKAQTKGTAGIGKIVVIGVHGWFTQSIFKNMIGEQTGTSAKFAAMQTDSICRHFLEAGLELNPEAITAISLQGDGKVADRVDRLFSELISRPNWVNDLKNADAIFLSAHSQGAIVATQLLARLIEQRQVRPEHTRICLLAMCGIHHGPFAHLKSSITASYINYFETAAAKELFEFQSSSTAVAKQYTAALKIVLDAGAKCVYVGSTDDNVVPIYSALNSSNNHPSILRALYIDGQAFPKVDFLTNLLVLCVAVRNAGLSDHNLLTLLSASVAGSLYGGKGHSNVYEERAVYDLATRYLFEVTHPLGEPTFVPGPPGAGANTQRRASTSEPETDKPTAVLVSEAFEAQRWNPYELPWSLRGLFEDKHVRSLFAEDMLNLLQSYEEWKPDSKNKALKDLQWRLAPVRSIRRPEVEGPAEEGVEQEEEVREGDKGQGKGSLGKVDGKGSKL